MIIPIIQLVVIFIVPILILKYHDVKLTKFLGTIGTAYLLGLIVALVVFLMNQIGVTFSLDSDIGEIGSFAAIGIAIPLLLFSSNLKEAKKLSKTVLISFASLIVSVMLVVSFVFVIYGRTLENGAELSAMAVGLYTGGTPNLNALGNIFGLNKTLIGVANLSDMMIGGVFYMFLLLLCKPLLKKFLKTPGQVHYLKSESTIINVDFINIREFRTTKHLIRSVLLAFGMAVVSALGGIVVWMLLGGEEGRMTDFMIPSLLIGVTVFGIIASFNKKIREVRGTNTVGQYLILVFSFALASSMDLSKMQNDFGRVLILFTVITITIFIVHVIFAKLLKIDVDCTMVTATAGIYGPAFIPAITKQIKNDALTVPGLICGSIGYAIGTLLGFLLGLLFML
ncbi:MAG TPA: DUF819 family protein [Bacilli bacterium]|nr:DUF819 family protein [Bacilli bacterium]